MTFLLNNRLWLVGAAVLLVFLTGYYVKGKFDEAEQAAILRKQIRATMEKQDAINAIAKATEAELLTERQKSAMLQKKWSTIRGQNRPVCTLDPDALVLLRDATGDAADPAR